MKNYSVRMIREHMENIPQFPIPTGFAMRNYRPDEGAIWTRIQRAAEPYFDVDDQLFAREFKRDFGALEDRSFYLTTDAGEEIGTITAWWQPDLDGRGLGPNSLGCDSPGLSGARACQADDVRGDGISKAIPQAQFSRHFKRTDSRHQSVSRFRILPRP